MPASGFDTGVYPGDAAVTAWAGGGSTFQFLGYYLQGPCHSDDSYLGKYPLLKGLGWGLAIVYVGRQDAGCGADLLSSAQGSADGLDAIAKCKAEGFPPGAIIYLDVEAVVLSAPVEDYVGGWIDALLQDATFSPGIYCHSQNAVALHLVGEQRYAAAGLPAGAPSFWVVRVSDTFDPATSGPQDSGVAFADIWQGQIDLPGITFAGATINPIDLDVASSSNPSKV